MHIIISCSHPYIFVIRERCLKYGRGTHFGRAKRSRHDVHLHPLTKVLTKCQNSTLYGIPRNSPEKILQLMVTVTRSKVISWSPHDVAHLQPLTNIPTKYQLCTPYGFQDIPRTRFYRLRSLGQGQTSNQGQTMMLHTYTP